MSEASDDHDENMNSRNSQAASTSRSRASEHQGLPSIGGNRANHFHQADTSDDATSDATFSKLGSIADDNLPPIAFPVSGKIPAPAVVCAYLPLSTSSLVFFVHPSWVAVPVA